MFGNIETTCDELLFSFQNNFCNCKTLETRSFICNCNLVLKTRKKKYNLIVLCFSSALRSEKFRIRLHSGYGNTYLK